VIVGIPFSLGRPFTFLMGVCRIIQHIDPARFARFVPVVVIAAAALLINLQAAILIYRPTIANATTTNVPDFNIAAVGDWGCNSNTVDTVNNIVNKNPELVLGLGDYSYEDTADCWLEIIAPLDDKMEITTGNHDVETTSLLNQYMSHFNLTKQFYSFNYQNVHFLAISSYVPQSEWSEQYNFVNRDLALASSNSSIDWIVVYHHEMQYTSPTDLHGSNSNLRDTFHPLFDKYGVDLVLQAHNHAYERTYPLEYNSANSRSPIITDTSTSIYNDPTGVIYVTVGIGGRNLFEYLEEEPYSIIQWHERGFLNMDVVNNGLTMKGTLDSNDGAIEDSFTVNKSGNTQSTASGGSSIASPINTTMTSSNISQTALVTPLSFVKNPSAPILLGHTEPDVIKVENNTFYMYYRNDETNGASINVMSSTDGLNWVELGSVLNKSSSGWDSAEVIAPSIYLDGSTYYLYYEAEDASEPGKRAIGVATATSPTGPFTKYSENPVLKPTLHWEGVMSSGYGLVGTPVITRGSNDIFYLFYHGFRDGADKVGVAYSNNPLGPWIKESNNPILGLGPSESWDGAKVAPSSVYFDGSGTKVMVFYEGFNGIQEPTINWRIGIADGAIDPVDGRIKNLTRVGAPTIDLGEAGSWDDTTVQLPSVIQVSDELWMYYSGNDGEAFRLGRAIAQLP
jgi:calcineurin-like phosphoesterase family protein